MKKTEAGLMITPEQRESINKRQVANILAKLNAGKSITAREQRLLDEISGEAANFARSWDELAKALGVTRRTIQDWRRDPRYKDHCPKDMADGRKDIGAWKQFMVRFGLKRADETVTRDEVSKERHTIYDWKEYREQLLCTQLERSIFRNDRLLLVATELEIALGATFAAINTKLQQFAYRAARFLVMCRDEIEAEEKLHYQMEAILKDLNAAKFIDDAVNDLPVEQREIARSVLRGIGQRAVSARY